MVANRLIKIDNYVKKELDRLKQHPRETYNDVLKRILEVKK